METKNVKLIQTEKRLEMNMAEYILMIGLLVFVAYYREKSLKKEKENAELRKEVAKWKKICGVVPEEMEEN